MGDALRRDPVGTARAKASAGRAGAARVKSKPRSPRAKDNRPPSSRTSTSSVESYAGERAGKRGERRSFVTLRPICILLPIARSVIRAARILIRVARREFHRRDDLDVARSLVATLVRAITCERRG